MYGYNSPKGLLALLPGCALYDAQHESIIQQSRAHIHTHTQSLRIESQLLLILLKTMECLPCAVVN